MNEGTHSPREVPPGRYSLEMALDAVGFGPFQIHLLFLCGFGYAAGTIELILASLIMPELKEEWPELSDLQLSFFPSITFLGELLGGIFWGWLGDKFGRRKSFVGTVLFSTLFGFLSAAAPSFGWLLAFRFFLGIALGGNLSVDFVIFLENIGSKSRGFYATLIILFGICGVLATAGLGWAVIESLGWRWYLVICTSPFLIVLVLRILWKHESPRYLLVSGQPEEAEKVLQVAATRNKKQLPPGQLAPLSPEEVASKGRVADLLQKGIRTTTLTLCVIWFSITFGYYGITIWLPKYLDAKDIPSLDTASSLLYMGLAELPGLAVSNFLIDRIGRKYSLGVAMIGCAGSSISFGFATTFASTTALSMCIYFFIVQAWSIVYVFTPELFPTTLRSTAFGITGVFATLAGMISSPIGGVLFDAGIDDWVILVLYSILFVIGGLAALTLTETSKTLLQDTVVDPWAKTMTSLNHEDHGSARGSAAGERGPLLAPDSD